MASTVATTSGCHIPPLPSPASSSSDARTLPASAYPRKKNGVLFSAKSTLVGLGLTRADPRSASVVEASSAGVSSGSKPACQARAALPTPPASDESDTEPSSFEDECHLGSFVSVFAFLEQERKLVKERDRQRRRQAEADRAARNDSRRRKTLHYPKAHDILLQQLADTVNVPPTAVAPTAIVEADNVGRPRARIGSVRFAPSETAHSSPSLSTDSLSVSVKHALSVESVHDTPPRSHPMRHTTQSTPTPSRSSRRLSPTVPIPPSLPVTLDESSHYVSSKPSQLRLLADKLATAFPTELKAIELQLATEEAIELGQIVPELDDASNGNVHVFVDHSNILVGLLQQILPAPPRVPSPGIASSLACPSSPASPMFAKSTSALWGTPTPSARSQGLQHSAAQQLSHPALSLLLLRGRHAQTKALVASSPLHQSLADLQLSARGPWDVAVLRRVRVDDLYEGMGDLTSGSEAEGGSKGSVRGRRQSSSVAPEGERRKVFKEQAVDELLQLKILQTVLLNPPSTLVLATGDCAGSPLNPAGFRGCAEIALERGWNVEVWGWKRGIGSGWRELERKWAKKEGPKTMVVRELDAFGALLRAEAGC